MRIVTPDDFIDIYHKATQRGLQFIMSKLNPSSLSRTKSAFSDSAISSSNWWIVPKVKERWNYKITGSTDIDYETYTIDKYFLGQNNLRMLSIGSGICSHEMRFAESDVFSNITCIDIADNLLAQAEKIANEKNITNMEFVVGDIWKLPIEKESFDVIFFHSSLHHFDKISTFINDKIKEWLKPAGLLIINEYVGPNRLQFSKTQISNINKGLKIIPDRYRQRFQSKWLKNKFYGSGYMRMVVADPSECIESAEILPVIHAGFTVLEEKAYGGNLLMNILKDIAHNFLEDNPETNAVLDTLFDLEDKYLENHDSDFLFGVYQKKLSKI